MDKAVGEDKSPAQAGHAPTDDAGCVTVMADPELEYAAEEGEQLARTSVKRKAPEDSAEHCKPPQETACYLCMQPWTSQGAHRICCVPCGHVHGRSCLENWLRSEAKCPQCEDSFEPNDIIIDLYVTEHLWNGCGHEEFIADVRHTIEENDGLLRHVESQQDWLDEAFAHILEFGSAVDSLVEQMKSTLEDTSSTEEGTLETMQQRIASSSKDHHAIVGKREEIFGDPAERSSQLATCGICMDPWTSYYGAHRICCIPCGHVYGRLCPEKWLRSCGDSSTAKQCPTCRKSFEQENIIHLSATNYEWNDYCGHRKEVAETSHRLDEFRKQLRHAESLGALNNKRAAHIAEYVRKSSSLQEEMNKTINSNADRSTEETKNLAMELLRKWPKMDAIL
ncbi:hypothetical protein ACQ4PT_020684 [Festuca glaucescens]